MTTLRNKLAAIGVAGTVAIGTLAVIPATVAAAPAVAPNQNAVKQAAPSNAEEVQRRWRGRRGFNRGYRGYNRGWRGRRNYGPAIALGLFGAFAGANYYHNHHYGYGPRYYHYGW